MYLQSQSPWFAFVVHARDFPDYLTMPGASLIRRYSDSDEEFVAKLSANPAIVLEDVRFVGSPVRGELVAVPRLPGELMTPDGHRAVLDAVQVAVTRGAPVVGLGALTAPATAGGRALLRHLPRGVTLTNGNGLTAAVARRNVVEAAEALGLGRSARVAVLGATGSVGTPLSHLLVDDGFDVVLVGSSRERVLRFLGDLLDRAEATTGLGGLADADIVLILTNDRSATVEPEHVKRGAIVIDVAQPHNVAEDQVDTFLRHGVRVVRGGSVQIPAYSCARDLGLAPGQTFACLAETYLMAREGIREHSVGRPSIEHARRMERVAEAHGVTFCPLGLDGTDESEPEPAERTPVSVSTEGDGYA